MSMFFSYRKTILKSLLDTSSIASYLSSFLSFFLSQSRQHLDTWWINQESFWPLDNSSTPGGSIEPYILLLVFYSSIASRHMICRCWFSRHLLDTSSIEIYWWSLNTPHAIRNSLLSISFSFFFRLFISQTSLTHSKPLPLGFSSFLQVFLHLVSFWSPSFTCI